MHHGVGGIPVDKFLTSMGGRRTRTDPTVLCFSSERLGTTYALVAAYVDDFIITGTAGKTSLNNSRADFVSVFVGVRGNCRFLRCASSQKGGPHDCS